ncbi:ATP-binding protein [Modestobacter sp. KNN46-3]|uniref:ATP-binding protein n=1 Tax=Modestobacter sp. KNN46-3 TaxID=2711218 RepID=UPI0013DF726A|nr:ATP-binding protein [Modestobacter sp. KNN46-3]
MLSPHWTSAPVPPASGEVWAWDVGSVADLPAVRRQLRTRLNADGGLPDANSAAAERVILAFDELVSNALRHGRGPVHAQVTASADCFLLDVSDAAVDQPPTAVDRDPAYGGMGLHLVAAYAGSHGFHLRGVRKHVWAALPVEPQPDPDPVLPRARLRKTPRLDY